MESRVSEKLEQPATAEPAYIEEPIRSVSQDNRNNLSDLEADVLNQQIASSDRGFGIATIYRYASVFDMVLIAISSICAIAGGAGLPLMTLLFGNYQGIIQDYYAGKSAYDEYVAQMTTLALCFIYLAIGEFFTVYIATAGFIYSGERISNKIRDRYLHSCLRQNIAYLDTKLSSGEITTCITTEINQIKAGISEKLGMTLGAVATFVSAFAIGFASYWKLTLVLCSSVFALITTIGVATLFISKSSIKLFLSSSAAGALAGDVFESVRTAVAFGTQERLAKLYNEHLFQAEKYGFKVKAITSIMVASMMLILYLNYALSFWVGSTFLINSETSVARILTVTMAIMMGAFDIGHAAPHFQAFVMALGSAKKIFNTIDRKPPLSLDPSANPNQKVENMQGKICFENIKMVYPSRPEVVVLQDFNIEIAAGKTTAVVGPSGSGKSTLVGLLERFYNPVRGTIYLDGRDISTLSIPWLRRNIGLVAQEPTLFNTTIFDNIRRGLPALASESIDMQRDRVVSAAKMANAHDFICQLPDGYNTIVGERGSRLSGGQKQRICIARAIISDPKGTNAAFSPATLPEFCLG